MKATKLLQRLLCVLLIFSIMAPNFSYTAYATDGTGTTNEQAPTYDENGFDANGFDANGFDVNGFDVNGYDANGFDANGFNASGYDANGYDANGFDANGFDANGFDASGYDANGLDINGKTKIAQDPNTPSTTDEDEQTTPVAVIPADRVLTVTFSGIGANAKNYTISFDSMYNKKQSNFDDATVSYPLFGDNIPTLKNGTQVFVGWDFDTNGDGVKDLTAESFNVSDFYAASEGGAKSITLTANYLNQNSNEIIKNYTIQYVDEEGSKLHSQKKVQLVYDSSAATQQTMTIASPSIAGYKLKDSSELNLVVSADHTEEIIYVTYIKDENSNGEFAYYVMEFYKETVDGTGYTIDHSMTLRGSSQNTAVFTVYDAAANTFFLPNAYIPAGYTYNEIESTNSVQFDTSANTSADPLVIKTYMDRLTYDITVLGEGKKEIFTQEDLTFGETFDIYANLVEGLIDTTDITSFIGTDGSVIEQDNEGKFLFPATVPAYDVTYSPYTFKDGNENKSVLTINYNANGGEFDDSTTTKTLTFNRKATIIAPSVSHSQGNFLGWVIDENNDGVLDLNETILYTRFGSTVLEADDQQIANLIALWENTETEYHYNVEHILLDDSGNAVASKIYTTTHAIKDGATVTTSDVEAIVLNSETLIKNANWDTGIYDKVSVSIENNDLLTTTELIFDALENDGEVIAKVYYAQADSLAYTVRYVVENDDGTYSDLQKPKAITRTQNGKTIVTEYAPEISGYDVVDGTPGVFEVTGVKNSITMNLETDGTEMMFVYEKLSELNTANYTINLILDGKVIASQILEGKINQAVDAESTDFVKTNADYIERGIKSTSLTLKSINANGSTVFNLELNNMVFYYDTYNSNAEIFTKVFTSSGIKVARSLYTDNSGIVSLDTLKVNGTTFMWVDEDGNQVTSGSQATEDVKLYAYIEHTVKVIDGEGNIIHNEAVEHETKSSYSVPKAKNIPAANKKEFSHWKLKVGPSGADVSSRSAVQDLLKDVTESITLKQVHDGEKLLDLVFEASTNFTALRYDRFKVEESDINLVVTKLSNGNDFTNYDIVYRLSGTSKWSNEFPEIRNSEDSAEVEYKITAGGYEGSIIGTVQVDVLPINLEINVPSVQTTLNTALTQTQIADFDAAIDTQIENQLLALGIVDPSKYSVNFGYIDFEYDANLVNTAGTYSTALGLSMEKRGESYNPNAGSSVDGTVYTISKSNYQITVNHGVLTVVDTSSNDNNQSTSTTPSTPAAAPVVPVVAPVVPETEVEIEEQEVPTTDAPTTEDETTTEIEEQEVPTTAAPEAESSFNWLWILLLLVISAGVYMKTKMKKSFIAAKDDSNEEN